jgi:exopolysaccharide production protein ExoQ
MKKKIIALSLVLKIIFIILVSFLATYRAIYYFLLRGVNCYSDWLTIVSPCVWINAQYEVLLWALTLCLLAVFLWIDHEGKAFFQTVKENWIILFFSALAFISLSWTIHSEITLYKAFVLFCVSLCAVYVGYMIRLSDILNFLILYFVFLTSVNFLYAVILPAFGIMQDPFYQGAWQGLFWHRNYLGCFMALGLLIISFNLLSRKNANRGELSLDLILFVLTAYTLIKTKSVTALISGLVSIVLICVVYIWTKVHHKIKPIHYYAFSFISVAGIILFLSKINFFLGFLGRNSSLTGRIPMWQSVYQYLISLRPWLGYGYGVIWHLQGIRDGLAEIIGWRYPVMIGDNGFIDIFLHLGIVGLVILIAMIIFGFIRGIKYLLQHRTIESAFPFVLLFFSILVNISLSLILESESFFWLLTLVVLVSISKSTPKQSQIAIQL